MGRGKDGAYLNFKGKLFSESTEGETGVKGRARVCAQPLASLSHLLHGVVKQQDPLSRWNLQHILFPRGKQFICIKVNGIIISGVVTH